MNTVVFQSLTFCTYLSSELVDVERGLVRTTRRIRAHGRYGVGGIEELDGDEMPELEPSRGLASLQVFFTDKVQAKAKSKVGSIWTMLTPDEDFPERYMEMEIYFPANEAEWALSMLEKCDGETHVLTAFGHCAEEHLLDEQLEGAEFQSVALTAQPRRLERLDAV